MNAACSPGPDLTCPTFPDITTLLTQVCFGAGGGYGRGDGRGRGRGDFEYGPAERIGPAGEAQLGTAARPGQEVVLPGTGDMQSALSVAVSTITPSLIV